jgi:hypothetical protein
MAEERTGESDHGNGLTKAMLESRAKRLIESHFVEGLRPNAFARLQTHLSGCRSCRTYYDRLFGFEAAYDGGKGEVDRIGAQVFAALNLSEPEPIAFLAAIPARIQSWFALAMPLTVAAGVLIAVFATQNRANDFTARGGNVAIAVAHPQILGLCFSVENGEPKATRELGSPGESIPSCPRAGRLKLAYRGATSGQRLVVAAVRDGTPSLVYPRDSDRGPMSLSAASGPVWLPGSFAISPEAASGTVEVVGYFGPESLVRPIEDALRSGRNPEGVPQESVTVDRILYRLE